MDKLIIKGERIQQIADIYLGNEDDFRYNPLIYQQKEQLFKTIQWLKCGSLLP